MAVFEKEKALKDLLKEFQDEIPENQVRLAYIKALIGFEDIVSIIGLRQAGILVNQLITTGKIHPNSEPDKTMEYIEEMKKGHLPDFSNSFYTIDPKYIFNLSEKEREKLASKFAEGDKGLESLLVNFWAKGIKTLNSCGDTGFKYVMFEVEEENKELLQKLASSEFDNPKTEIIFAKTTDGKNGVSFIQREESNLFANLLDVMTGKRKIQIPEDRKREIDGIMNFVYRNTLAEGVNYLAIKQTYKGYNIDVSGFNYKLLEFFKKADLDIVSDPSIVKGQRIGLTNNSLEDVMNAYNEIVTPKGFGESINQLGDGIFYTTQRYIDRISGLNIRAIKDKAFIERLQSASNENVDVLKSMSDEIWSLKEQASTAQSRLIDRNIQILKLKTENKELIQEEMLAEEAREDAVEDKERAEAQNARLEKQVEGLRNQNKELSTKNDLLIARNEKLEMQNTELKDMLNRVKDFVVKRCSRIPFVGKSLIAQLNEELNEKSIPAPKQEKKEKFETRMPDEDQK